MVEHKVIQIINGDIWQDFVIYKCSQCGEEVPENFPHYLGEGIIYCHDCSFKKGKISGEEYLWNGFGKAKAGVSPITGEIEVTSSKYFSWEKTPRQQRDSPEYAEWRTEVFNRDNYTCQSCGIRGGELNAHHVKSFAKHKKLRTVLSNGITLCEPCHRKAHKGVIRIE